MSLKLSAITRRVDALFKAMSSDFLLREQFVTNPSQIIYEYVHNKSLSIEKAIVNNQLLYSVVANPLLLTWLKGYLAVRKNNPPSQEEFRFDFARALFEFGSFHIVLALMRSSIEQESTHAFDDVLLQVISHIFDKATGETGTGETGTGETGTGETGTGETGTGETGTGETGTGETGTGETGTGQTGTGETGTGQTGTGQTGTGETGTGQTGTGQTGTGETGTGETGTGETGTGQTGTGETGTGETGTGETGTGQTGTGQTGTGQTGTLTAITFQTYITGGTSPGTGGTTGTLFGTGGFTRSPFTTQKTSGPDPTNHVLIVLEALFQYAIQLRESGVLDFLEKIETKF